MNKTTRNVLIGAGIAVAGAAVIGVVHHYSTKYLMKLALNREGPKATVERAEKIMSSGDLSQTLEKLMDAAKALEEIEHETIEITADDGTVLVGHWFHKETDKRAIVAMHGWRSNWSRDFGTIAPFWLSNDCSVLFAEQRGQGNSGGEYMGFGLLERFDCRDWVNKVNELTKEGLPLYLAGLSMGATTVLMTAGFALPDNLKGIIADCGFTSPHAIWEHVVENNLKLPFGLYSRAAKDIFEDRVQIPSDSYSTLLSLQSCKVPVLFIHGTDDNFVPIEMTYENYKSCVSEKHLFVVPGAEHGTSYLIDKAGYEKAVTKFFKAYD